MASIETEITDAGVLLATIDDEILFRIYVDAIERSVTIKCSNIKSGSTDDLKIIPICRNKLEVKLDS